MLDVGLAHLVHLHPPKLRLHDALDQPLVLGEGAVLGLDLDVLGQEPIGQQADSRGGPVLPLGVGRVLAFGDKAQDALGFPSGEFGCPGRAVLADGVPALPTVGAVLDDVDPIAPLAAHAEAS